MHVTGSGPGILYDSPKTHKRDFATNFSFRPIFAAYNAASYKLSKFLVSILAPFTINNYTVKNSYSFVSEICNKTNSDDLFVVSFDVESLFNNIPIHETINICLNYYLFPHDNSTVIGLAKKLFRTLLEHSVLNSFFLFDSKLYKQTEGLGIGLCPGPTFANIFMCYHEQKWLSDCPNDFPPIFYRRYIDDLFLLFKHPDHAKLFLNYLNCQHQNVKFTCETELD